MLLKFNDKFVNIGLLCEQNIFSNDLGEFSFSTSRYTLLLASLVP